MKIVEGRGPYNFPVYFCLKYPASPKLRLLCYPYIINPFLHRNHTTQATSQPHLSFTCTIPDTGMLGKSLSSPLLTFESATSCSFSSSDHSVTLRGSAFPKLNLHGVTSNTHTNIIRACSFISSSKTWKLHFTSQTESVPLLENEERKMWEASRQALSTFKFSEEEADMILRKAFGWVHSPYWGEEREKEVPKAESVNDKLDYLSNLGLTVDDMFKFLKKFPEVLGCSLDDELKISVQILEKEWGIKGNSLRNLLLRNPKVLGYNVDCKGDCMAKCTRCWVRF